MVSAGTDLLALGKNHLCAVDCVRHASIKTAVVLASRLNSISPWVRHGTAMHAYNGRFNICGTGARNSTNKPWMSSTVGAPKTASERSSAIRGRKRSKRPTDPSD